MRNHFEYINSNSYMTMILKVFYAAGGELTGRSRLTKILYFLEVMGLGNDVYFEWKYYGPYSEDYTNHLNAISLFLLDDLYKEKIVTAPWGGKYSVFESKVRMPINSNFLSVVDLLRDVDIFVLELLSVVIFLANSSHESDNKDPWGEAARRKTSIYDKENHAKAMKLYKQLLTIESPKDLPVLT